MKEYFKRIFKNGKIKKTVGVILMIIGFAALITPLTPGSWFIFIGLEFLGFDLLFWKKIKLRLKLNQEESL